MTSTDTVLVPSPQPGEALRHYQDRVVDLALLTLVRRVSSTDDAVGHVLAVDEAGTTVPAGFVIHVDVGAGKPQQEVPDLIGTAPDPASFDGVAAAWSDRLTFALDWRDLHVPEAGGLIVAQDPAAGSLAPRGTVVTLTCTLPA
ncbi:hypothetical protein ACFCZ3_19735 [Cellulosimicrobium cellulans]|uniref:hypothetical protein n=1 Tax=Cellulosimicrobium cellulans TaxID=1710 RepID=UPI0035DCF66E